MKEDAVLLLVVLSFFNNSYFNLWLASLKMEKKNNVPLEQFILSTNFGPNQQTSRILGILDENSMHLWMGCPEPSSKASVMFRSYTTRRTSPFFEAACQYNH